MTGPGNANASTAAQVADPLAELNVMYPEPEAQATGLPAGETKAAAGAEGAMEPKGEPKAPAEPEKPAPEAAPPIDVDSLLDGLDLNLVLDEEKQAQEPKPAPRESVPWRTQRIPDSDLTPTIHEDGSVTMPFVLPKEDGTFERFQTRYANVEEALKKQPFATLEARRAILDKEHAERRLGGVLERQQQVQAPMGREPVSAKPEEVAPAESVANALQQRAIQEVAAANYRRIEQEVRRGLEEELAESEHRPSQRELATTLEQRRMEALKGFLQSPEGQVAVRQHTAVLKSDLQDLWKGFDYEARSVLGDRAQTMLQPIADFYERCVLGGQVPQTQLDRELAKVYHNPRLLCAVFADWLLGNESRADQEAKLLKKGWDLALKAIKGKHSGLKKPEGLPSADERAAAESRTGKPITPVSGFAGSGEDVDIGLPLPPTGGGLEQEARAWHRMVSGGAG